MDEEKDSPWELAVCAHDLAKLRSLMTEPNFDPAADIVVSALQSAAEGGHWEVVQFFLGSVGTPLSTNRIGEVVLQYAASAGRLDVVMAVVDRGTSVASKSGSNALFSAATRGDLELLRYLADACANLKSTGGLIACAAAKVCQWEAVNMVLSYDVDIQDGGVGVRLMSLLGAEGQDVLVSDLIAQGVDVKSAGAQYALLHLSSTDEWETCRRAVRYLIEAGVDVTSHAGEAALVTAAKYGDLELLQLLVKKGVNVVSDAGGEAVANAALLGGCSDADVVAVRNLLTGHGAVAPQAPSLALEEDF